MTPQGREVDFRIVESEGEETGFELVDERPEVQLVPVRERPELVLRD